MTTDITELAQSHELRNKVNHRLYGALEFQGTSGENATITLSIDECKSIIAAMDERLALVEALEKAKGMEAYWKVQCRGITDHCEVLQARIAELEPRTVKLPDDAEHDIMAPVAAYLSEKFKWDGSAARWDGRNEYDVLADRVKYALRMVIRRAAGIKVEVE
ncbi:hypothetical protein C2U42_00105 (plasmid) [Klebsiella oxytoca]|nr:hypothetical protein C2U42_00105 [Klebsiella oxytoca]